MKYDNLSWVILIVSNCFAQDVIPPTEPTDVLPLSTYAPSPSFPAPDSLNAESPVSNLITQSTPEISPSVEITHQPIVVTQFPLLVPVSTQSPSDQPWQPTTEEPLQLPTDRIPRSPNTGGTWSPSSGGPWPPGSGGPWPTGPVPWNPPEGWMLQQSNWTQSPNSVQPTMGTEISSSTSNPMMGWMEWQRMYNSSMPMMQFPPMSGSSNSSMPIMLLLSMLRSSNSSMSMMPFPQMPALSNSSTPMISFPPMTGSSNSSMPLMSISSMPGSSNSSIPIMSSPPMSGSSNPSMPLMPVPPLLPSMPPENINQPMYYDRIEGERNIMRPCEINDIFCIRRYLRNHSHCKERYGSIPEPFYRAVSPVYLSRLNMTLSREDILYRGLNGRITEFYVNPETDNLVLSVQFINLSLESNNTFLRFHRQLQEPIVTRDFFNVYYSSLEATAIIPNLKDLQLHKSEVFVYADDALPAFTLGPNAFLSNAYTASVFPDFLANVPANVREDGLTNGAFYIGNFIQYRLCDFGLQIL